MSHTISENINSLHDVNESNRNVDSLPSHMDNASSASNSAPITETSKSKRVCSGKIFSKMKLEILIFLFMFATVLTRITSTSLILDKVCLVHFKYSKDICDNLNDYTEVKVSVEKLSTYYQLGHSVIQIAPAALLSCFVGPWSDRYGRKLPVMIATIGMVLFALGSAICAFFLESPVEYYYIPAVFAGAGGGSVSLLALVYSYASDMTPLEHRTMKYAFIELSSGLAQASGVAAGGWIYNFFGYPPVFYISMAGFSISLIWIVFMLPETQGLENEDPWNTKIRNLFSCNTFKESFAATTKEGTHQGRRQIILLVISTCFIAISTSATGDINYLFVLHEFNWGNTKYSTITSIYAIVAIVVLLVLVPLCSYCKVKDATLGLIGSTSILIKFIGIGLSWRPEIFHAANILGVLSAFAPMAARSRISKIVSKDDLGKVFQFVASGESLLPVLSTVITSLIFYASIDTYPGAPYTTLGILLLVPFSVFVWIGCLPDLNHEIVPRDYEII